MTEVQPESNALCTPDMFFRDGYGRAVILRGINFSASNKAPLNEPTQEQRTLWKQGEAGTASFVGQCVGLEDGSADVHLRRLRSWGFNNLRYIFTWEAIEHAGPGQYDIELLEYTVAVIRRCKAHGFRVVMDPHQDLFSRFSGGSGAPLWALTACGMNPRNLHVTGAAVLHRDWPSPDRPDPEQLPKMIWNSNYQRVAVATLFTLFFGGRTFAPRCNIDGKNIQDWLQDHYLSAVGVLAYALRNAGDLLDECVLGWDSMNEPSPGYIGWPDLNATPGMMKVGPMPTPAQGFVLGVGRPQTVHAYEMQLTGPRRTRNVELDPQGVSMWLTPDEDQRIGAGRWGFHRDRNWHHGCVWALHGVWEPQSGRILKPNYFMRAPDNSERVDFIAQFWLPHWRRYSRMLRQLHPQAIMFVQPPVFEPLPRQIHEHDDLQRRACSSAHFYDGVTLLTKHWNSKNFDAIGYMRGAYSSTFKAMAVGAAAVRMCLARQVGRICQDTDEVLGNYPTWIGETGIPFDMDNRLAYYGQKNTGAGAGDYTAQTEAMDATMNAVEANLASMALWTYCPDNSHQWGDGWNGEDFSIFSADVARGQPPKKNPPAPWDPLFRGARAIAAWCRPYPVAVVGTPARIHFDVHTSVFTMDVLIDSEYDPIDGVLPTEIFVPFVHYGAELPTRAGEKRGNAHHRGNAHLPGAAHLPSFGSPQNNVQTERIVREALSARNEVDPTAPGRVNQTRPGEAIGAGQEARLEMAIDVEVSTGSWEIEGQYLRWYFGQYWEAGESTHTIRIARTGGPVDFSQVL